MVKFQNFIYNTDIDFAELVTILRKHAFEIKSYNIEGNNTLMACLTPNEKKPIGFGLIKEKNDQNCIIVTHHLDNSENLLSFEDFNNILKIVQETMTSQINAVSLSLEIVCCS